MTWLLEQQKTVTHGRKGDKGLIEESLISAKLLLYSTIFGDSPGLFVMGYLIKEQSCFICHEWHYSSISSYRMKPFFVHFFNTIPRPVWHFQRDFATVKATAQDAFKYSTTCIRYVVRVLIHLLQGMVSCVSSPLVMKSRNQCSDKLLKSLHSHLLRGVWPSLKGQQGKLQLLKSCWPCLGKT